MDTTISKNHVFAKTDILRGTDENAYQMSDLYKIIKLDSGAYERDGIKCLRRLGGCKETTWPYKLPSTKPNGPDDPPHLDKVEREQEKFEAAWTDPNLKSYIEPPTQPVDSLKDAASYIDRSLEHFRIRISETMQTLIW